MNHRDDEWRPEACLGPDGPDFPSIGPGGPDFNPGPRGSRGPMGPHGNQLPVPVEEEGPEDEPQNIAAIRRIEYVGRLHHMTFSAILSADGLPPAQINAIRVIIRNPGMSQRQLSDELHIQRATTTVMLQKMERAGFIDRRPDPQDQRVSRIYPTEAAIAIEDENHKLVDSYFARCFDGFSQAEFDTLNELLGRLAANIRSAAAEPFPKKE